ncbi:MAG: RNA polymerase sigma factor [Gemmatimonadales bacterium]
MLDRSGPAAFPRTRGSLVERLRDAAAPVRRDAFDALVQGYWKPIYKHVRLTWHLSREDAEDAVQGFFALSYEKEWLARFDPALARFRTFLRTCVDRFVQNERQAAGALKRGGGGVILPLDFAGAEGELARHEPADPVDQDELFHREFVRSLFADAVEEVREECRLAGKEAQFRLFERYDLGPEDRTTYADLAREADLPVTQVTNHLAAVRRMFRARVLERLRALSGSEDEYRAEARAVLGIEVT